MNLCICSEYQTLAMLLHESLWFLSCHFALTLLPPRSSLGILPSTFCPMHSNTCKYSVLCVQVHVLVWHSERRPFLSTGFTTSKVNRNLLLAAIHHLSSICQSSKTRANADFLLRLAEYFMNINGAGIARHEIPPSTEQPGPTPRLWNKGFATKGRTQARIDRRKVFAAIALAAYLGPYVSARKLRHC